MKVVVGRRTHASSTDEIIEIAAIYLRWNVLAVMILRRRKKRTIFLETEDFKRISFGVVQNLKEKNL